MSQSRYNEPETEYETEYEHDDPDLVQDESEPKQSPKSSHIQALTGPFQKQKLAMSANPDDDDPKKMIVYKWNWIGAIINFLAGCAYGTVVFYNTKYDGKLAESDNIILELVFKIRYAIACSYFVACLFKKSFVHESRNAEAPMIIYTLLEVYYNFYEPTKANIWSIWVAIGVTVLCCMRRNRYIYRKDYINPWTKDKTTISNLIAAAKRIAADLTDL